jgi:hypothetical protein
MMKTYFGLAALAALLASPALAQSYDPEYGTGNAVQPPVPYSADNGAMAYAPARTRSSRTRAVRAEPKVYAFGHDVGTDPDPSIRLQLRRDWPGRD